MPDRFETTTPTGERLALTLDEVASAAPRRVELEARLALTFDDVSIVPGMSEVHPSQVDLRTIVCRRIPMNIPILSAAMDTVTESRLAIAVAQEGGIGIVHKNLS